MKPLAFFFVVFDLSAVALAKADLFVSFVFQN
jgi:hypothetical protein